MQWHIQTREPQKPCYRKKSFFLWIFFNTRHHETLESISIHLNRVLKILKQNFKKLIFSKYATPTHCLQDFLNFLYLLGKPFYYHNFFLLLCINTRLSTMFYYANKNKKKKKKMVEIYVHILAHCNCKAIVPTRIHHFGSSVAQLHTGQHVWQESIDHLHQLRPFSYDSVTKFQEKLYVLLIHL